MNDDWWKFIYPGYGKVEFRYITNGLVRQEFTALPNNDCWVAVDPPTDVYYGVLPRQQSSGKAEGCWDTAHVLWADIDAKMFCPDHCPGGSIDRKQDALNSLLAFPLPPSAIIDSGHGFHAYWRLKDAVPFAEAQEAMKGIAKWVKGDHTYDQPRVLRVPGTTNWKDPQNPVPVRLLKLDTLTRYHISDFNEMVESIRQPERTYNQTERRGDAPDWLKDLIDQEPPKGQRSEAGFKAALWLSRYGYTDDQILTVLMNSPVGAKAQERGERWAEKDIARTVRKA